VYLSDGSLVRLDAETTIVENFTKALRRVELEVGRASFDVVHDSARPLEVAAGTVVVRALGTRFNVSKGKKGKVIVAVIEGSVEVNENGGESPTTAPKSLLATAPAPQAPGTDSTPAEQTASARVLPQVRPVKKVLVSGQQIVVDTKEASVEIASVDIEKADAWQTGRLYFQTTPLIDVLGEVNRYMQNKLIIEDKRLETIPITMNFNIKHRKNFIRALEGAIPIQTRFTSSGRILLTMRD
ncbi:MAG: FecR domain-containing protein, partial [Deltaproteobacteria bacterium]|nr:FecR domain-containing protein [Deltaproteobacteria bacterium]